MSTQDLFTFLADYFTDGASTVGGRDRLGAADLVGGATPTFNRKGYVGYEHDIELTGTPSSGPTDAANPWPQLQLARHRWYRADLGAWTRRDPMGYVDGGNVYAYVMQGPISYIDNFGLAAMQVTAGYSGCLATSCGGVATEDQTANYLEDYTAGILDRALQKTCEALKKRLENIDEQIKKRIKDIVTNPQNLPWDPDWIPGKSPIKR